MSSLSFLGGPLGGRIPGNRPHLKAFPGLLVDFLGTQVGMLPITAENIGKPHLHLEGLEPVLNIVSGFRVPVIHHALHQLLPRLHIELDVSQAMIEEGRTSRHEGGDPILHEYCPMNRPDAFNLLKGHESTIHRSGPESPDQGSILRPEAINRSVRRSKYKATLPIGGRRVDPRSRREFPLLLTGGRGQGV